MRSASLEYITFGYGAARPVLQHSSLSVPQGEYLSLLEEPNAHLDLSHQIETFALGTPSEVLTESSIFEVFKARALVDANAVTHAHRITLRATEDADNQRILRSETAGNFQG